MKKRGCKSQASVEFIMTYGWAIMIAMAAIGSLAYYGVINPDEFLPSRCILEFGIVCVDFKVQEDAVTMVLFNGRKEEIQIPSINVAGCTGIASGSLKIKEQKKFIVGGCSNTGKKFRAEVNVTFIGRSDLVHKNVGSMIARVENGCGLCACQNIDTNCGQNYLACANCNNQDSYSSNYCSGNSVVRDFDDYSCSSNQCALSSQQQSVENCASNSGTCQSGACACSASDSSCGTYPSCSDCSANNGICQSSACVCANTASSCGNYPSCSNCGSNMMCYSTSCLWDLNGVWTLTFPGQGGKLTDFTQTGNHVEVIMIDDLNPGADPGEWILRFDISGNIFNGSANNEPDPSPNDVLIFRGTITNGGNNMDGEVEYPIGSNSWTSYPLSKN